MDIEQGVINTVRVILKDSKLRVTHKSARKTFVMKIHDDKTLIPYVNINFYIRGTDLPLEFLDYLYELSKLINKYYDVDIFRYFGVLIIEYGYFNRTFNIFYRESKFGKLVSGKQKRKGFIISINIPLKKEELLKEIVELNQRFVKDVL